MLDEAQQGRRGGTVTVLALLVTLLLGYGGPAGAAEVDSRSARLGQFDAGKASVALRTAARNQSDAEEDEPALPAPPRPDGSFILLHPGSETFAPYLAAAPRAPARFYQARAPPAG